MADRDYGELFCQAVDEIVKKRLEGVSYDSTILCTIVDDSNRDQGIYQVSNGSAKFEAISAITSYRNDNNVYVQIPGGDMNEQKIIIAKKTDTGETPYVYQRPFSTLVDVTGNLISSNINSNETGLRANSYTEGFTDAYNDREQAVTLWTYNIYQEEALRNEEGTSYTAFTRLGIQGGFQSWLNPFYVNNQACNVIKGEYGLRLRVYTIDETISTDIKGKESYYDMYLNCDDMNGNPYNFQTFYQQEKVFDISSIGTIYKMELQFYQEKGSFVDKDGNEIPFQDFLGNFTAPNLFVKDPYISLGYDISEFDKEMVQIYTFDSTTYNATASPLTNNHKQIHLRWIHELDDGTFMSVTDDTLYDYEVRWYRYELGHASADEYSGVYWKNLSNQISKDGEHTYEIQDNAWIIENTKNGQEYQRQPGFFSTWLLPDITLQNEQVKAIIIYNGKPYRSNILKCENEREVVNKATVDAVQALSVNCEIKKNGVYYNDSYGNFRIYNQGNSLIDYAQAQMVREWVPYFSSSTGADEAIPTPLIEAESIEWIIPTQKTMIVIDDGFKSGDCEISEDTDKRLHIKRYGSGVASNELTDRNTQKYRIKSYYSQTDSDNTIQCKIVKNNTTYTATKELTFGVAGTTGTDCTFILDFDNGVTAITNDGVSAVTVTARLYDYENEEIDISNRDITWSFKNSGDGLLQTVAMDNNNQIEVRRTGSTWSSSNYNILQAQMIWGDTTLYAYLPIPIRSSDDYAYISGTTQVIYNSAGEILDYFKNPFAIYDKNAEEIAPNSIEWSVVNAVSAEDGKYTPTISKGRDNLEYLTPLSFYVQGACENVCVVAKYESATIWSQPLLIMQNKYPSAMINKWDGKLKIDEENGAILAPRLVAGIKNSDNTFSGVMMGNWGSQNADNSLTSGETGLYGFDHGEQTYAFREDGTAFIGKSGAGRIEFDGDEGIIESGAFDTGTGMSINLAEGTIDAHTFTLTAGKTGGTPTAGSNNTILINTEDSEYPLRIGSNFYVNWNGDLVANDATFDNGTFYGTIYASGGELGNLEVTGTLTGGTIKGSHIIAPATGDTLFEVTSSGTLTATGANITGIITATTLKCEDGQIGGWTIGTTSLSGGNTVLNSDGSISAGNGVFTVGADGALTASNANITGTITATGGTIGGWTIYQQESSDSTRGWNSLYATDEDTGMMFLDPTRDYPIAIGVPSNYAFVDHNYAAFKVKNDGSLMIGGKGNPFYVKPDGSFSVGGDVFSVTASGAVTASNITASGGKIGNWSITSGSITNGTTILGSDGKITAPNIAISGNSSTISGVSITNGTINNATITQGSIGSLTIKGDCDVSALSVDNMKFNGSAVSVSTVTVVTDITKVVKTGYWPSTLTTIVLTDYPELKGDKDSGYSLYAPATRLTGGIMAGVSISFQTKQIKLLSTATGAAISDKVGTT